ncbi:MAG TPA: hypothetical protein VH274_04310 [Mycobacteriales bacterium]|nr:hypothetical protein [Mycobacteriales bacterium]
MLAAIPLLAVAVVDGAAVLGRHSASRAKPVPSAAPGHDRSTVADRRAAAAAGAAARVTAIRSLLDRRGDAVMTHDATEWRATLDPQHPSFVRRQLQVFDNLQHVSFASWSYDFDAQRSHRPAANASRYRDPTWTPADFSLAYRLRGFDRRATSLQQYPTFVHRASGWYLTSLTDYRSRGDRSSTDLWDYGPVIVVRTAHVLVLGHPGSRPLMRAIATEVASDIPRVSAVWGDGWPERAVVLLPTTQPELGRVVDDYGDLDNIAAVATAEVQIGSGRPDPVGDRIGINPANWPKLSPLGQRIVLTHELTHVATRAATSAATPTWLAEGFADYVGYLGSGVPTAFVAQDLGAAIRAGRAPRHLPLTPAFDGANARLSVAYESAWMACRMIADRWGQSALVRLYAAVGRSRLDPATAVDLTMRRLLHVSIPAFTARWRGFVRSELD